MKNHESYTESNRYRKGTWGTETSKYPEEEKSTEIPRVVASESGRGQTNGSNTVGVRTAHAINEVYLNGVGKPTIEGESPVRETRSCVAVSRVLSGTWNPVRIWGDHPPSLNTT